MTYIFATPIVNHCQPVLAGTRLFIFSYTKIKFINATSNTKIYNYNVSDASVFLVTHISCQTTPSPDVAFSNRLCIPNSLIHSNLYISYHIKMWWIFTNKRFTYVVSPFSFQTYLRQTVYFYYWLMFPKMGVAVLLDYTKIKIYNASVLSCNCFFSLSSPFFYLKMNSDYAFDLDVIRFSSVKVSISVIRL